MKQAAIYGIVLLVVALLGGAVGYTWAKRASDRGVIKQQQKDAKAVQKHDAKTRVIIKEVEKIKVVVRKIHDPDGCLDSPVPSAISDRLRDTISATRSASD